MLEFGKEEERTFCRLAAACSPSESRTNRASGQRLQPFLQVQQSLADRHGNELGMLARFFQGDAFELVHKLILKLYNPLFSQTFYHSAIAAAALELLTVEDARKRPMSFRSARQAIDG